MQVAKALMHVETTLLLRQLSAERRATMENDCIVGTLGQHDPWLSLPVLQDTLGCCHGHEAAPYPISREMMELVAWRSCIEDRVRALSGPSQNPGYLLQ